MITNAQIKSITALKEKKYRSETECFVVEGRKMVDELLGSDFEIIIVYALSSWQANNGGRQLNEKLITVNEKELSRISSLKTPDEVLAVVKQKRSSEIETTGKLILALDNINNPGNLGTIIRIAGWFGVKDIVCNENTVDCYNPKVLQSTMGAIFHTNILYTDLKSFLQNQKTAQIYGTVLQNGRNIYQENLTSDGIIIIGSESHGISKEILQYINRPITIPTFAAADEVESLNASVACGIILSEFKRR